MKRITLLLFTSFVLIIISAFTVLNSHDPQGIMKTAGISFQTGSPYDKSDCSSCHSGGATTPMVMISATPAFGSGNTYRSGTTYTISVNCSGSYPKYGFGLEILNSNTASASDAGTFGAVVTSNCKKVTTSGKPTNIEHTAPTGTSNAATFSFSWTAPASGNAYLYCCINGVNGNGGTSGDKPQPTSLIITQSTTEVALLEQNLFNVTIYPNPASDHATLEYTLAENTEVKIDLYDISGKRIAGLFNETQNQGDHRQTINLLGMNLKSGIYFVIMKAGDKTISRKLVVE